MNLLISEAATIALKSANAGAWGGKLRVGLKRQRKKDRHGTELVLEEEGIRRAESWRVSEGREGRSSHVDRRRGEKNSRGKTRPGGKIETERRKQEKRGGARTRTRTTTTTRDQRERNDAFTTPRAATVPFDIFEKKAPRLGEAFSDF